MNIYFNLILIILILDFLLDILSSYFSLKSLRTELPAIFKEHYSTNDYKKTQKYNRERIYYSLFKSTFSFILLLVFWLTGGFNYINNLVISLYDNELFRGLLFWGIIGIGMYLVNLPFKIYSIFVIEEKYGFNKYTPLLFLKDTLKGIMLSIILGLPILAFVLYILGEFDKDSWYYIWGGIIVISFLLQYIAPTYIMPLFNKFTELEDGSLKDKIFNFAEKVDYPLKNIFVIDGSKRSTKSNAFFTGFGKNKRIALFDTLVEKHTEEELVAVLAHEIGHFKKKHVLISSIFSTLQLGLMLFILSLFIFEENLYKAFFIEGTPVYAGLLFFSILYSPLETFFSILGNLLSRKNEFEADEYAVVNTGEKDSMISALIKLSLNNMSNLSPHKFNIFMHYSHPPVTERIQAIEKVTIK